MGTARAANRGSIMLAAPKVRAMAAAAASAGLLEHGLIERLLEAKACQVADASWQTCLVVKGPRRQPS